MYSFDWFVFSAGRNCMTATSSSSVKVVTERPMAEVYSPDQICIDNYGEGSYVCRVSFYFVYRCAYLQQLPFYNSQVCWYPDKVVK